MKAEIYTKDNCKFCVAAKNLMNSKGIEYEEISAPDNLDILIERVTATGNPPPRTAPQIFLDGEYVGGFDRLSERLNKA